MPAVAAPLTGLPGLGWTTTLNNVKRFIASLLVLSLVLVGGLSSPAAMALTSHVPMPMASMSSTTAPLCTMCANTQPAHPQHGGSSMANCSMALCDVVAGVQVLVLPSFISPSAPRFLFHPTHHGRPIEGPDPYPPRFSTTV